jgi:hypothetical protein
VVAHLMHSVVEDGEEQVVKEEAQEDVRRHQRERRRRCWQLAARVDAVEEYQGQGIKNALLLYSASTPVLFMAMLMNTVRA